MHYFEGKTPHKVFLHEDLSLSQVNLSVQTFNRCAKEYAEKWEWCPETIKQTKKYNTDPFLKYIKPVSFCEDLSG